MKKRINLTLDEDVYAGLDYIPRGISVSELVNWLMKVFVAELRLRRELTHEELVALTDSMEGGRDFRERMETQFGPLVDKARHLLDTVKGFGNQQKR